MKNVINKIFTGICLVSLATSINACGRTQMIDMPVPADNAPQYVAFHEQSPIESQLLIKFKSGITKSAIEEFNSKYGTRTVKVIPGINVYLVEIVLGIQASKLVKYLENEPLVKYAEVNHSINLNPDQLTEPVYTIMNSDYSSMIGKKINIEGVYHSSRSGAVLQTGNSKLSVVDLDGTVLTKLAKINEGTKVMVSGVIKQVNGFNVTNNLGVMPVDIKKI